MISRARSCARRAARPTARTRAPASPCQLTIVVHLIYKFSSGLFCVVSSVNVCDIDISPGPQRDRPARSKTARIAHASVCLQCNNPQHARGSQSRSTSCTAHFVRCEWNAPVRRLHRCQLIMVMVRSLHRYQPYSLPAVISCTADNDTKKRRHKARRRRTCRAGHGGGGGGGGGAARARPAPRTRRRSPGKFRFERGTRKGCGCLSRRRSGCAWIT